MQNSMERNAVHWHYCTINNSHKKFPIYSTIKMICLLWFYVLCFYRHLLWTNYPIHTNIFTPVSTIHKVFRNIMKQIPLLNYRIFR
jgi:hypothetical protein